MIKKFLRRLYLYKYYVQFREYLYIKNIILDTKQGNSKNKKNIYVLIEPEHDNIGDHAIAFAQQSFLYDNLKEYNKFFITENLFNNYFKYIQKIIKKDDYIFIHGGGNLGNQYIYHENSRRRIVENFPNNKIISFPQTIYFTPDQEGKVELEKSKKIYSRHKDLTFIAREETSFDIMKKHFKDNNIILTPDIVLYLNNVEPREKRLGALICFRNDDETILNNNIKENIKNTVKKYFNLIKTTDMRYGKQIPRVERYNVLSDKFKQFKTSELVITDRLHGMIFAAITGTPCIAISNYNHKVKETYKWIDHLNYIKFVDNFNDIEKNINLLKSVENCNYDNEHFRDLYKQILDLVK